MRAGPLLLSAVDCNSVSRNVIIINILTCYSAIKIDWPLQHKYGQLCYGGQLYIREVYITNNIFTFYDYEFISQTLMNSLL